MRVIGGYLGGRLRELKSGSLGICPTESVVGARFVPIVILPRAEPRRESL